MAIVETEVGFGRHSWPDTFSPIIAQRVVDTVPGMTRDRVFSSVFPDKFHLDFPVADKFVCLFIPSFPVDQKDVTGAGSYNTAFDSRLEVRGFVRVEADAEGRSNTWLEDQTFGIYTFAQQLLKSLHMWNGTYDLSAPDTPTLRFLRRPMRIMPGFDIERREGRGESRWGLIKSTYQCSFVASLGTEFNYPGGET